MADPFIGEIRIVAFSFPPLGWADCDGQLLSIAQNDALFSLLGTTFGGDGQTTFALPDFRGRTLVGTGNTYTLGQPDGVENVTLTQGQMPTHTHTMGADTDAGGVTSDPTQGVYATLANAAKADKAYGSPPNAAAAPGMLQPFGGSQPHENRMPFLCMRVCIALEGIFPPRN
jgi:microcystin-dependent protein